LFSFSGKALLSWNVPSVLCALIALGKTDGHLPATIEKIPFRLLIDIIRGKKTIKGKFIKNT